MKRLLIILAAVVLAACGKHATTAYHIEYAQQACAANGGVSYLEKSWSAREFVRCGYRRSCETGRIKYEAGITCKNGAVFDMEIVK